MGGLAMNQAPGPNNGGRGEQPAGKLLHFPRPTPMQRGDTVADRIRVLRLTAWEGAAALSLVAATFPTIVDQALDSIERQRAGLGDLGPQLSH